MIPAHDEARAMIDAAHERARELGIAVTAAVVDANGLLVALGRMDGAIALSVRIAEAKAHGSAVLGRDGDAVATMSSERPGAFDAFNSLSEIPLIPGKGGLVIRNEGMVVGAVGVSGGTPDQDVECAEAALEALGTS